MGFVNAIPDGEGVLGYNCARVNALRDVINNTAQKAGQGITEILHSDIIVPMSGAWYAPEAVDFFEGFKKAVSDSGKTITEIFDGFREAVQRAGESWAENTGGEAPSLAAIDSVELDLNVSEIQPNNGGDVIIDGYQASAIAKSLSQIEEAIKADLSSLAANLNAETAFIGRGQAEALQNCFVAVSGEIHRIFRFLTNGEDSLQAQINKAIEKYGQVSEDISGAFNGIVIE